MSMSRSEAGYLGGVARHRCRGWQCNGGVSASTGITASQAGSLGGNSPHVCRGWQCNGGVSASTGITANQAGRMGGLAPHRCRGRQCSPRSNGYNGYSHMNGYSNDYDMGSYNGYSSPGTMSRQQAGRLGGIAPHRCRGRQCSSPRYTSDLM